MSKVLLVYEDFTEMMNIESVLKKVGVNVFSISSEFTLSQQILSFNPDIVVGYGKGSKVSTLGVGRRLKEMPRWTGRVILIFAPGAKPDPGELGNIRMDMALEAPVDVTRFLQILAQLTNEDPQKLIERMMRAVEWESNQQGPGGKSGSSGGDGDAVVVSGGESADESWNVRGNQDIEEFNRMMGLAGDAATTPAAQAPAPPAAAEPSGEPAAPAPIRPDTIAEAELHLAQRNVHEKVEGYGRFLDGLKLNPTSSMNKKETKKAQKRLASEWKEAELKGQDDLRRGFTQALYKKKD